MSSRRWPGQRREAEPDRHDDLAADLQVVLEQQVVVLADRAVDDVLDRDDAGVGLAGRDDLEDLAKAAQRDPRDVAERGDDRVLGERAGLAGIGDRRAPGGRLTGAAASRRSATGRSTGVGLVLHERVVRGATSWITSLIYGSRATSATAASRPAGAGRRPRSSWVCAVVQRH